MKNTKSLMKPFVESLAAILIGLIVGALILIFSGYNPVEAYLALFGEAFTVDGFARALAEATPIILTALTFALGARTGLFNIGGEGTVYFGAIMAIVLTNVWGNVLMGILGGILAGAVWMAIPAVLKVVRGVNEVVSTIMLNWIAWNVGLYLLLRLQDPKSAYKTISVPEGARLPLLVSKSELSIAFILAVLVAVLAYYLLWHTTLGYELRVSGLNESAARYGGINPKKAVMWSFIIGGITSGLAGALEVMGKPPSYAITQGLGNVYGYGFDGIGVALVGRNHPWA